MRKLILMFAVAFYTSCQVMPPVSQQQDVYPPLAMIRLPFLHQQSGTNVRIECMAAGQNGIAGVYFRLGTNTFNSFPGTSNWTTNIILSQGEYLLQIYAMDLFNLISPIVEVSFSVTNTPDTVPPTLAIFSPSGMDPVGYSFTVVGTADDNVSLEGIYCAVNGVDYEFIGTDTNWFKPLHFLVPGLYPVRVFARDYAGNNSITNEKYYQVDPGMPLIAFTYPAHGVYINTSNMTVTGTASDDQSIDAVYFRVNSGPYGRVNGTNSWSTNLTLTNGPGTYKFQAYALDNETNYSSYELIQVNLDCIRPTVAQNGPTNNQLFSQSSFSFYGQVNDNFPLQNGKVYYRFNGAAYQAVSTGQTGGWATNLNLTNGYYTMDVYAVDNAGNISDTNSIDLEMRYDAAPPTVSITNLTNGQPVLPTFRISGLAADDTYIHHVTVVIDSTLTITAQGTNIWTTTNVTLADGFHDILARATDVSGKNSQDLIYTVVADSLPPVIDLPDEYISNSNCVYEGYFNDFVGIAEVGMSVNSDPFTLLDVTNGLTYGNWATNLSLVQITNQIKVYGKDLLGHVSITNTNSLIVDMEIPTNRVISHTNFQIVSATYTITGKTGDNDAIKAVLLMTNGISEYSNYVYLLTTNWTTNWNWSVTLSNMTGTNDLVFWAFDKAQNSSCSNYLTLYTDLESPLLNSFNPGGGTTGPTNTVISGVFTDNYAVDSVYFSIDNPSIYNKISITGVFSTNLNLTTGDHALYVYARDLVNNTSLTNSAIIHVTN